MASLNQHTADSTHVEGNDGVRTDRRITQRSIHRLGSECTFETTSFMDVTLELWAGIA